MADSTPGGGFRRGIAGTKSHSSKKETQNKNSGERESRIKKNKKKSAIANQIVNSAACG